ncbi:hypothetical protein O181_011940 [Austropuccinia psidii MF-1]|uniref:Uncharacterized protein n=1 Tax=Austropuccinia psidii MF-1 TaxID=1389203 RepID=A0A9Q3GME9_9BASI|nr:hypothetical protein [Austropuccinia psidii MF-1]
METTRTKAKIIWMKVLGNNSSSHSDFEIWSNCMGGNHASAYWILRISEKQEIFSSNLNFDESFFPALTPLPTQKPPNAQNLDLFSNLPHHCSSVNENTSDETDDSIVL